MGEGGAGTQSLRANRAECWGAGKELQGQGGLEVRAAEELWAVRPGSWGHPGPGGGRSSCSQGQVPWPAEAFGAQTPTDKLPDTVGPELRAPLCRFPLSDPQQVIPPRSRQQVVPGHGPEVSSSGQ